MLRTSHRSETRFGRRGALLVFATVLFASATIVGLQATALDDVTPPPVPSDLKVQAGNKPFLIGHAYGTQNYSCLPSSGGFMWTQFSPQATLFDDDGGQLTTHFLSPNPIESGMPRATWQHSRDTSAVWAVAIVPSTDPNYVAPGAIPWLLLRVVGAQYGPGFGDRLTPTTFIQRVNTNGGLPPATGCATAADVGKRVLVPYAADYVFYRAR